MAAVSGRNYEDFVQQRVLDPLGMHDTLITPPHPDDPELAVGYGRRLPGAGRTVLSSATDYRGITAAANMTSTVTDLARFAMLQFRDRPVGGDQILRGSTLREMQRVHWPGAERRLGASSTATGEGSCAAARRALAFVIGCRPSEGPRESD